MKYKIPKDIIQADGTGKPKYRVFQLGIPDLQVVEFVRAVNGCGSRVGSFKQPVPEARVFV